MYRVWLYSFFLISVWSLTIFISLDQCMKSDYIYFFWSAYEVRLISYEVVFCISLHCLSLIWWLYLIQTSTESESFECECFQDKIFTIKAFKILFTISEFFFLTNFFLTFFLIFVWDFLTDIFFYLIKITDSSYTDSFSQLIIRTMIYFLKKSKDLKYCLKNCFINCFLSALLRNHINISSLTLSQSQHI